MKNKDIHVVFGEISASCLVASQVLGQDSTETITLSAGLNIGPLVGLDYSETEMKARVNWFLNMVQKEFVTSFDKEHIAQIEDLSGVSRIVEYAKSGCKIYLWTGWDVAEVAATARLIHYLPQYPLHLFMAEFSNVPITNIHGEKIYAKSLSLTKNSEIKEIFKHFKVLSEQDFMSWKERGRKLMAETGTLRVLRADRSLEEVPESYFDEALLNNCNDDFQASARVVAYTLIQIDFGVGDGFLAWRLREMAKNKKISYRGELGEMRHYEIKLVDS